MTRRPRGAALAALAAGLTLAVLAGCGGDEEEPAPVVATAPGAAPARDAASRLELGVVALAARIGEDRVTSSGVVIDADRGLVITLAQSVWGARSLKVSTGLAVLHGRIVARDPCGDLALVETQPRLPGLATLPTAPREPRAGEFVTAVGRRYAEPGEAPEAVVRIPARRLPARELGTEAPLPAYPDAFGLDAPLIPDAMGGPVVDAQGRLVGLVRGSDASDTALTVPWSAIRSRLRELRPGPNTIYVGWRDSYRCAETLHAFAAEAHPGFEPSDAQLNPPVEASRLEGTGELDG